MSELIKLPEGWTKTKLGKVLLTVIGGGTPSRKVPHYFEGSIPWFTVKDMANLKPDDAEEHISEAAVAESATNVIPANTVIVATRISLGRAIRPKVACAINQDLKALTIGTGVNPDFILHWFIAHEQMIKDLGSGTTVSGITLSTLDSLPLLLPPSPEQDRIVMKLEEVLSDLEVGIKELEIASYKLIQFRQSLIKSAIFGDLTKTWRQDQLQSRKKAVQSGHELLQKTLDARRKNWEAKQIANSERSGKTLPKDWKINYPEPIEPVFSHEDSLPEGWAWATLSQLTELITSGSRGWADYYSTEGATFIRSQNINKDELDLSDIAFVKPPKSSEGSRTLVSLNDLLLTITGANVGKAAHVSIALDEAYVSQHVALIRPVAPLISKYIHLYLTADAGGRGLLSKEAYGAGKPGLNLKQIGTLAIPLPNTEEIAIIIEELTLQLDSCSIQSKGIERAMKQGSFQRKNILKAAFSGSLMAQNSRDRPASELLNSIEAERIEFLKKPNPRKMKMSKIMKKTDTETLREWILSLPVEIFTFDDAYAHDRGNYEVLKDSVFKLLGEDNPIIEQIYDTESRTLKFRRITQ